jgi:hypothetical protein
MDIRKIANEEFEKANLIMIDKNSWIEGFIAGYNQGNARPPIMINTIESYRSEIMSNVSLRDLICMQQHLTIEEYDYLVLEFIQFQMVTKKIYASSNEVFNHLRNWIGYNKKNILDKKKSTKRNEGLL